MERTDTPTTEKTGDAGTWLVINSAVGKYIARTLRSKTEIHHDTSEDGWLEVVDCFEFISNLQAQPVMDPRTGQPAGMNLSKQTIACRVDATLFPVRIWLPLRGSLLYFLDDLKEADALAYKDIIQDAVTMGQQMHKQRVENLAGIKMAPPGAVAPVRPIVR